MKNLLKKSRDPYLALLAYRSTPLEVGFSPAELLMSRRLRTTVPDIQKQRQPSIPDSSVVVARDDRAKKRQKDNFDAHRRARNLLVLEPGDTVLVTNCQRGCWRDLPKIIYWTDSRSIPSKSPTDHCKPWDIIISTVGNGRGGIYFHWDWNYDRYCTIAESVHDQVSEWTFS